MRLKSDVSVTKLMEHPMNKELFNDIQDTDPVFWNEFKKSIEEFGIIEPLIVNEASLAIRSGNQRFKAAVQLGLEKVPVLYVEDEESDEEIRKMIASNVYRRTIDPFAMFRLIGRMRSFNNTYREIQNETHKPNDFISAAAIFEALPEEHQAALKEWFRSQGEDEKEKTQGELIAMISNLETDNTALEQELRGVNDETATIEERIAELEKMLAERDEKIDEISNTDYLEAIDEQAAEIVDLLEQKTKLNNKIKELQESPDINYLLIDCVKKQKAINAVLKPIVENAEVLNPGKLDELGKALKSTLNIIKKGTEKYGQTDRQELISERETD